jgi:putative zinc finger/helix-turn-helix YgiT family protein
LDVEGLADSKCLACGYIWVTDAQRAHNSNVIRTAYTFERDRRREQYGLLSGPEIAQVRSGLGLNQREAASLFGGGLNAFNKYESGEVLQSFAMDRLLRLAKIIGKPVVSFLRDVTSPPAFVVTSSSGPTSATTYSLSSSQLPVVIRLMNPITQAQESDTIPLVIFERMSMSRASSVHEA